MRRPRPCPKLTVFTDQLAGPPLMGLGAELDPYDTVAPDQINWSLLTQRLAFMRPGFLRVVEPASTYFSGYDTSGNPTYRWTDPHVQELLSILSIAKSLGITVVLGDWGNPVIGRRSTYSRRVHRPASEHLRLHEHRATTT